MSLMQELPLEKKEVTGPRLHPESVAEMGLKPRFPDSFPAQGSLQYRPWLPSI